MVFAATNGGLEREWRERARSFARRSLPSLFSFLSFFFFSNSVMPLSPFCDSLFVESFHTVLLPPPGVFSFHRFDFKG